MVRGSNCESLTMTRGSDQIITCLAIHSPNTNINFKNVKINLFTLHSVKLSFDSLYSLSSITSVCYDK